ncbi:DUF4105 domain-containing protein [Photobacterium lipolyticum]|uniref:Lnb N-terminal periplasmic domain-containing protein n=1 Tax=Photobacterium lipolyticum TaxID=266810 RepID=A0A2T3N372_9GAMM|nr:DUF4105 domain-containing protein [Photobacterium lipolyticum]PSW06797.1 hypothetical protein C9I89_04545 [Photobacterium lipolyticum]
MIRYLLLISLLLAGCAQQPTQEVTKPISIQDWQQLEARLQPAPPELRKAIEREAKDRLVLPGNLTDLTPQGDQPMSSGALLHELLKSTENPLLLTDQAFYQARITVSGNQVSSAPSYARILSDYLMAPDFACEQPIYARYFQERYHGRPSGSQCNDKVPFVVIDRYKGGETLWLSPKRVSAIHLLFAGEGHSMSSRFGHIALRLVVCPEGQSDQESCDSNLFEHLVLGYMAHIDEFELNTFKALSGRYNAYLFAFPFIDIYRDYAISEFREVYSLPLVLNQQQREQMVKELAEIHWRFSGDYRFFSQNCASFLQQTLHTLLPEMADDEQLAEDFVRPDHLFSAARQSRHAEGDKLSVLETAEQQGYYFSSTMPFYSQAVSLIHASMSHPEFTDLTSYLQLSPIKRLDNIYQDARYLERLKAEQHLFNAQLLLEELAYVRSERRMMAEGTRYFQHLDDQAKVENIHAQLSSEQSRLFDACLLRPVKQITEPVMRMSGIPSQAEIPALQSAPTCESQQAREELAHILSIVNMDDQDKAQWKRVISASHLMKLNIDNIAALNQSHHE